MKKITDERLVLQNLQHIRIAYIVQTVGILAILGYEFVQGGMDAVRNNPLWMVFMITSIIYSYLSMSVSVEHEKISNPKRSLTVGLAVVVGLAILIAVATAYTPGSNWTSGAIVGLVILVCGAIPVGYTYKLKMKQLKEWED